MNNKQRKQGMLTYIIVSAIIFILVTFCAFRYCSTVDYFRNYHQNHPNAPIPDKYSMEMVSATFSQFLASPIKPYANSEPRGLGVIVAITLFLLSMGAAYYYIEMMRNNHAKEGTENGTAKWYEDIKVWNRLYSDPPGQTHHNGNRNMIFSQDVYMSMDTRRTRRNNNVFVIGGSGAGKSRFFVKPNLCEMPLNVSFICTDPSGELLGDVGTMMEGAGYDIQVFDLVNMKNSGRYNPFKYIRKPNDVILLVDCIMANTTEKGKSGGDPFWDQATKMMFQAFAFLIWQHGKELNIPQNLNSINMLMSACTVSEEDENAQKDSLTSKYFNAIENDGFWTNKLDGTVKLEKPNQFELQNFDYTKPYGPNDIGVKQYHKFMSGAGKTLKSILISSMARLSVLDTPEVYNLLNDDDIGIDTVGDRKSAMFIIIPQDSDSFNFLAAILYTQLFQFLYFHAQYECQGNYIVEDSRGENVKIFEVPHKEVDLTEELEDYDAIINQEDADDAFAAAYAKKQSEEDESSSRKLFKKKNQETDKKKTENKSKQSKPDKKAKKSTKKSKEEFASELDTVNEDKEDKEDVEEITRNMSEADLAAEEANRPDDDPGEECPDIEALANEFCERVSKTIKAQKTGNKWLLVVPSDGKHNAEVIGVYGNKDFAMERYEAIKNGCRVKRNGLFLPCHVRFMLDEFANIGQIPDFDKKLATMRKYEISSSIIMQNMAQLKKMYEKDWGTIIGNCDSFLYLGSPEFDTNEYVSKMLGKGTIITKNRSISHGEKGSTSESLNKGARELITPDELYRLDNDTCIYLQRGEQPFKTKKHTFISHKNYPLTADNDKSLTYVYHHKVAKPKAVVGNGISTETKLTMQQMAESTAKINEYRMRAINGEKYEAGSKLDAQETKEIMAIAFAKTADKLIPDDLFGDFYDETEQFLQNLMEENKTSKLNTYSSSSSNGATDSLSDESSSSSFKSSSSSSSSFAGVRSGLK